MKRKLLLFSISLGILSDHLFWDKPQGISFAVYILSLLILTSVVLHEKKIPANRIGLYFLLPISFFMLMSFMRVEPLTSFLNRAVTLMLIGIWAAGYESANWKNYGLVDYLHSAIHLVFHMVSFPLLRKRMFADSSKNKDEKGLGAKSILRGLALAIPPVILFSLLFASADMVFAESLEKLLSVFDLNNIGEYFTRFILIFLIANALIGLVIFTSTNKKREKLFGKEKPFLNPFLGKIESGIVLSSILLLYITFIVFQFNYFFFNQNTISEFGFTYSEYARRGFGELIAASISSLVIILTLNTVTVASKKKAKLIPWLHIGLVLGNLVILLSAFMRLNLYESAFGFTRLRIYSHVFIFWLGILLIATGVLAWKKNVRQFTNFFLLFAVGFSVSLNLVNVDNLIVRRNIQRTKNGDPLDASYLSSLSSDAIPPLINAIQDNKLPDSVNRDAGAAALCFEMTNQDLIDQNSWQSFTLADDKAKTLLDEIDYIKTDYTIVEDDWSVAIVDTFGKETFCSYGVFFD